MATPFDDFDRITVDPNILGGKPCIRGMRLSVQLVLKLLADYPDHAALFADYPELEPDDLRQVLQFAARAFEDRFIVLDATAA